MLGKCGVTGRKVYEPLSTQGSKFYAVGALYGTMYAVVGTRRFVAGDSTAPFVEPDDEDIEDTARGMKAVIERRIPSAAAWDDIAQLAMGLGSFALRASRAKAGS